MFKKNSDPVKDNSIPSVLENGGDYLIKVIVLFNENE